MRPSRFQLIRLRFRCSFRGGGSLCEDRPPPTPSACCRTTRLRRSPSRFALTLNPRKRTPLHALLLPLGKHPASTLWKIPCFYPSENTLLRLFGKFPASPPRKQAEIHSNHPSNTRVQIRHVFQCSIHAQGMRAEEPMDLPSPDDTSSDGASPHFITFSHPRCAAVKIHTETILSSTLSHGQSAMKVPFEPTTESGRAHFSNALPDTMTCEERVRA